MPLRRCPSIQKDRMKGLPLVEGKGAKTGCITVEINATGGIKGFKHGGGSIIPQYYGEWKTKTQFIQCQNQHSTVKWMTGAACQMSFHTMPINEYIPGIFLIIMRGLFFCPHTEQFSIAFHRWNGDGCVVDLYKTVLEYKDNSAGFVQKTFHSVCELVNVDDIHITWLNQITGDRIRDWKARPGTYQKEGRMFYQSGGQPNSWCNQDPFSGSVPVHAGVCLIVPPPKKLNGHFLQSMSSKIDNTSIYRDRTRK